MKTIILLFLLTLPLVQCVQAQQRFVANFRSAQVVPPTLSSGFGRCFIVLNADQASMQVNCNVHAMFSAATAFHIHEGEAGTDGPLFFNLFFTSSGSGGSVDRFVSLTPQQVEKLRSHRFYIDVHSNTYPNGEVRGQIKQPYTVLDDDDDGRTDPTVFRPDTRQVWVMTGPNKVNIYPIPLLYSNLSRETFLRNSWGINKWLVGFNTQNQMVWTSPSIVTTWGSALNTDAAVPADYEGDGAQDQAIFRRANGEWWISRSGLNGGPGIAPQRWGMPGDNPSVGDYDGDGFADLCVVRLENGAFVWYIRNSSNLTMRVEVYGNPLTDTFLLAEPIDIDGDSKQDMMVYRDIDGQRVFFIRRSSDASTVQIQWGLTSDTPIFGDYDGDGKTDIGARRDENGIYVWYVRRSSDGQVQHFFWGKTGDV